MKKVALYSVMVVLVFQSLIGVAIYIVLPSWTERGQFGDMFGVVNTLFSGLAFAGVIWAILLQREELQLQREELRLTRQQVARSASAQERSEAALSLQARMAEQAARLTALNNLLHFAEGRIDASRNRALNSAENDEALLWQERRASIVARLDETYNWTMQQPSRPNV